MWLNEERTQIDSWPGNERIKGMGYFLQTLLPQRVLVFLGN